MSAFHRAEESPGFLLWHVTLRWQRDVAAALRPLDLTHVQFVLLASLWWLDTHGEQPTQTELAAHAGVDVKMLSEVVRTLERKGLVTRRADAADSRARRLGPTATGTALAPRAVRAVEAVDEALLAPLSATGRTALVRALRTLAG